MTNRLIIGCVFLNISCSAWSANWSSLGQPVESSEFKFSSGVATWAAGKVAKTVARKSGKSAKKPPSQTGGPVVITGPTRGENRSRNKDGTWRKKRSDAEE